MDHETYNQLCLDTPISTPTISIPPFAEVLPFPITNENNPEAFKARKKWMFPENWQCSGASTNP
jgi:hypothetical protein